MYQKYQRSGNHLKIVTASRRRRVLHSSPCTSNPGVASALLMCLFASGNANGATNIVVNGNFAGGTQSGPGTDTVPKSWAL